MRENSACQPLDAYSYLKASEYFYFKDQKNNSLRSNSFQKDFTSILTQSEYIRDILPSQKTRILMSQMNADEQAGYNLAKLLCIVTKRKLIGDSDFIIKEFNFSAITNYVNENSIYKKYLIFSFFSIIFNFISIKNKYIKRQAK